MAEERTTLALPIEEINQLTKTLVATMAEGTPKEIAKGLKAQFVDRSTEHLYRKVSPVDQSGSSVVYKYIKGEIESAFIPTRRDMKLSFPPTCYSSNDPITLLYESNYKLIQYWTLAILGNDDITGYFLKLWHKQALTAATSMNFSIPSVQYWRIFSKCLPLRASNARCPTAMISTVLSRTILDTSTLRKRLNIR